MDSPARTPCGEHPVQACVDTRLSGQDAGAVFLRRLRTPPAVHIVSSQIIGQALQFIRHTGQSTKPQATHKVGVSAAMIGPAGSTQRSPSSIRYGDQTRLLTGIAPSRW